MNEPKAGLAKATTRLLSVAFFLAGPILALAPLGMAPLLIAAAALAVATERAGGGKWLKPASQPAIVFTVFLAWCAVTLIWTLNPAEGARKLADLALVLASTLGLQAAGDRATQAQRRILALALAGGMAVGLILLSVETAFDFPLYRAVMGSSDPRLADMVEAKRSVDALPLLAWPAALAVARLGKTWLAVVLLAVFTVASFKWTASSATLAMLASLVLLGLAFLSVKAVRRALMGATILAFLLIVPFAIVAYDAGSTTAGFLKHSAQHRFEIWHFAAEKILERPLFGYGFNSSRHIPNGTAVSAFLEPGKPIIPLHPHDGFLQIWLELGAVGAVLSAIALLATLRATAKWPDRSSRFALPGYAAALIVAGLAFGIWQTWWMATLAFSAIAFTTLAPGPDYA
jgi:O-antigen ligase